MGIPFFGSAGEIPIYIRQHFGSPSAGVLLLLLHGMDLQAIQANYLDATPSLGCFSTSTGGKFGILGQRCQVILVASSICYLDTHRCLMSETHLG